MESIEFLAAFWPVFVPIFLFFAVIQIYLTGDTETPRWLVVPVATLVELLVTMVYVVAPWEAPYVPLAMLGLSAAASTVATAASAAGVLITLVVWLGHDR